MTYSQSFIDQAREIAIVDVASRLGLKIGKGGWASCPLHGEKTASFHLRPKQNAFYCFGCQAGGDTIALVRNVRAGNGTLASFTESMDWFRDQFGLVDSDTSIYRPPPVKRDLSVLQGERKKSTGFKLDWSIYEPFIGPSEYVVGRGLSYDTAVTRRLGYDGEMLRALWPITDHQGILRAVSGRLSVDGCLRCGARLKPKATCADCDYTQPPKWLHSGGFEREHYLYGEDQREPGDVGILVEGLIDRDVLWQYGYPNVLATMGTALAKGQVDKCVSWFRRLIVFSDGDEAGRKMAAEWSQWSPVPVWTIPTPDGHDPASLGAVPCGDLLAPAL